MREHAKPIAETLVKEVAKPANDALTEVLRSADLLDYTAEEAVRFFGTGEVLTSDSFTGNDRSKLCLVQRVALGVVIAIPPFNYPVNLAVSKIGPALMAGNSVVLKPPTQGCVSGLLMMRCFEAAGLPAGLINVVTGRGSEIGDYITMHPLANALSFTGGDTGLKLAKQTGMIPIQMELGGKDACIVCKDADIEATAKLIVKGAFSYSGQRCTAVKVVLVEESVADDLTAAIVAGVNKLTIGAPEDNCNITPVISSSSADFIEGLIKDAESKGATFLTPYRREQNLLSPVVLDHVTANMRIAFEEPFGPVLPIMRIPNPEAGVEHANSNRLALQGCIFTRDINKAIALSDALEVGTVQINSVTQRGPDHFPFQAQRDSGMNSQGVKYSLQVLSKLKSTVINLQEPSYQMG